MVVVRMNDQHGTMVFETVESFLGRHSEMSAELEALEDAVKILLEPSSCDYVSAVGREIRSRAAWPLENQIRRLLGRDVQPWRGGKC